MEIFIFHNSTKRLKNENATTSDIYNVENIDTKPPVNKGIRKEGTMWGEQKYVERNHSKEKIENTR